MNPQEKKQDPQGRSEEELRLARWMEEAQHGDSASYRHLLNELGGMMERFVERAVKRSSKNADASVAHDIVQEILVAVHNKRHTYDPARRFLPWVFGIARHKLVDWQRKHYSDLNRLVFDEVIDDPTSPHDSFVSLLSGDGEPSAEVHDLLGKLSERERTVLELTKIQGLSVAETAEKTGLSPSNVKVLTHRAIAYLKKIVAEEHRG